MSYYISGRGFSRAAVAGLQEYQAFRAMHPGLPRAVLSEMWKGYKAQQFEEAGVLGPKAPLAKLLSAEEVTEALEALSFEEARQNDPKYLHKELLNLSQHDPGCYPYGLTPQDFGDIAKLQSTLARVKRSRRQV